MAHSDHALRRMVARLPTMSKVDFDSIMQALSGGQRAKVIMLLEQLEGENVRPVDFGELHLVHAPLVVPDNLSSWLVARVNGNPAAGDEVAEQFSMTAHATAALRLCAAELVPQPQTKSSRPSLLEQLWQRFAGDRLAA